MIIYFYCKVTIKGGGGLINETSNFSVLGEAKIPEGGVYLDFANCSNIAFYSKLFIVAAKNEGGNKLILQFKHCVLKGTNMGMNKHFGEFR